METSRRTGGARDRVLAAALDLFAEHGVSGTSLQMIADDLGVTKAAVYHQFQSKEDIVRAVIAPALEQLARVAEAAESRRRRGDQVATALSGVVDLVVRNRRLAAVVLADPTVGRLVRGEPRAAGPGGAHHPHPGRAGAGRQGARHRGHGQRRIVGGRDGPAPGRHGRGRAAHPPAAHRPPDARAVRGAPRIGLTARQRGATSVR